MGIWGFGVDDGGDGIKAIVVRVAERYESYSSRSGSQEHTYLPKSRPDLRRICFESCMKSRYKYVMTSH